MQEQQKNINEYSKAVEGLLTKLWKECEYE